MSIHIGFYFTTILSFANVIHNLETGDRSVHHWQLRQTHAALQSLTRKMLILNLVSLPMLSQVYSSYSTIKIASGLNRDV